MPKTRSSQITILAVIFAVSVGSMHTLRVYGGLPWTYDARLEQFYDLREDAASIEEGMPLSAVMAILGVPDYEQKWLSHLPSWRIYYFDSNRDTCLGRRPKAYISVLIDSETGVKTVDIYDPIFESCTGHKIESTCTPINRKHHDRFAGPTIIGA